jgi:hypothetical protein
MIGNEAARHFMLNRSIHFLLIATLVACPLLCGMGHTEVRAAGDIGTSACGCCKTVNQPRSTDQGSCPPHDSAPDSENCCPCICGGAVVEHGSLYDVGVDTTWSLPAPVEHAIGLQAVAGRFSPFAAAAWPDIGMNPGRALCCLYNTLLC